MTGTGCNTGVLVLNAAVAAAAISIPAAITSSIDGFLKFKGLISFIGTVDTFIMLHIIGFASFFNLKPLKKVIHSAPNPTNSGS